MYALQKLKFILDRSKTNHKVEILKQSTLKDAHLYCKLNELSGQVTGPLVEMYIKTKYNMSKNQSSSCIGDVSHHQQNIEIKVSNGGKDHYKFNYVQLRMNHLCDYLLTAYYISATNIDQYGELFVFKVPKHDMKPLILKYGGYAHGTIQKLGPITKEDLNDGTNDKEYAIRPKYGDSCWNELLPFRIDEKNI